MINDLNSEEDLQRVSQNIKNLKDHYKEELTILRNKITEYEKHPLKFIFNTTQIALIKQEIELKNNFLTQLFHLD